MIDFYLIVGLLLSGVVGGFLAGLIGIGGGLVYVFLLLPGLVSLGVSPIDLPQFVVANSLFCVFFASSSSVLSLLRMKQVYWKESFLVALSSFLFSYLAFSLVVQTPWFDVGRFNYVLVLILCYMLFVTFRSVFSRKAKIDKEQAVPTYAYYLAGMFGGGIASLSGLGGGVLMIPILNGVFKIDIKRVRSISLLVISCTSLFMTCYNLFQETGYEINYSVGNIVFPIAVSVGLGTIIGGPLGVKVSTKLSSKSISTIYLFLLTLFIVKKVSELSLL